MEDATEVAPASGSLPAPGANGLAPVPTASDADPTPQHADSIAADVQAPPGLEQVAPPSKEAQASFASAANGVADAANSDGKVVLNGA